MSEYGIGYNRLVDSADVWLSNEDVYNYYVSGGFLSIIANKVSRLCISYFLIFIFNFLVNCIDYNDLLESKMHQNIWSSVDISRWYPKKSPYLQICTIIYIIYLVIKSFMTCRYLMRSYKIKKWYESRLGLNPVSLKYLSWYEIVAKINDVSNHNNHNNHNNHILLVNMDVCREYNILTGISRSDYIWIPQHLSILLEWNFIKCCIDCMSRLRSSNEYLGLVRNNCIVIGIINIIALPFIITIALFYMIIRNGEEFYHNPVSIFRRHINRRVKWQLRYYNELPHEFEERLNGIDKRCLILLDLYKSRLGQLLVRVLLFIVGSIFMVIVIVSLLGPSNIISNKLVIGDKSVVWVGTVLGSIILMCRRYLDDNHKKYDLYQKGSLSELFDEVRQDLSALNPNVVGVISNEAVIELIKKIYTVRCVSLMHELIHMIATPYYIYYWYRQVVINHQYITGLIEYNETHGNICRYSNFLNSKEMERNGHMVNSIINFRRIYPSWNPPILDLDF